LSGVVPVTIDVDGLIDLVADDSAPITVGLHAGDVRKRRLNDIMIVLEREHAELENAIQRSVRSGALGEQLADVRLTLDERAPKFHVAVDLVEDAEVSSTSDRRSALEADVATPILGAIERRAVRNLTSERRHWHPIVTATCRMPQVTRSHAVASGGFWLKSLMMLIVLVILGVGYLFFAKSLPGT